MDDFRDILVVVARVEERVCLTEHAIRHEHRARRHLSRRILLEEFGDLFWQRVSDTHCQNRSDRIFGRSEAVRTISPNPVSIRFSPKHLINKPLRH